MVMIADMRALIASTISVAAAAALVVPLTLPRPAAAETSGAAAVAAGAETAAVGEGGVQSLPLRPLDDGTRSGGADAPPGALGLAPREVARYALVGIVWSDATATLDGRAQVRTRSRRTGEWSAWQDLHASAAHGPDETAAERRSGTVRGGTDPLWVGDSDAVEARVLPGAAAESGEAGHAGHPGHADQPGRTADGTVAEGAAGPDGTAGAGLPEGLRLELVDPGDGTAGDDGAPEPRGRLTGSGRPAAAEEAHRLERALDAGEAQDVAGEQEESADHQDTGLDAGQDTAEQDTAEQDTSGQDTAEQDADVDAEQEGEVQQDGVQELAAGRPAIVTRSRWGADESWREPGFAYTDVVKTVFVHHTAGSNGYTCAQAPSVIRSIYRYHTQSQGWRDIGYNFLVDKCGTVYEGRAGGVDRPVMGAHTYGFNHNSMGVAVLGSYGSTAPSAEVNAALARLSAWKLGLDGRSPTGTWRRVSTGGKYARGTVVTLHNISGHRDGYNTACPGDRLYRQLPAIRTAAGRL